MGIRSYIQQASESTVYYGSNVNKNMVIIQLWGAGGGGGTPGGWSFGAEGGGGGYIYAEVPITRLLGKSLILQVGEGGLVNGTRLSYGGGGQANRTGTDNRYGSNGGGYTGLFIDSISQSSAIAIAGGGGGGGSSRAGAGNVGGAGGGNQGQDGVSAYDGKTSYRGLAGTQTAGGAEASSDSANSSFPASALVGGTARTNGYGGAGGGGYWGGSAGGYSESNTMGGGGGGSGYLNPFYIVNGRNVQGNLKTPAGISEIGFPGTSVAYGGNASTAGKNGFARITVNGVVREYNYSGKSILIVIEDFPVTYESLTYTTSPNLTITGNGTDTVNIFKTSGSAAWDNQAYSLQQFTAPCTIEFNKQAASTDNGVSYAMIGWNVDPTTDANYTSLDYASYPYQTSTYRVHNNGAQIDPPGSWSTANKFYIVYDVDGYIRHYNGSTLLYSVDYGKNKIVYVDSSFYSPNATFGGFSNLKVTTNSWNGTSYDVYPKSPGTLVNPFSSPAQAQSLNTPDGNYYFKSGFMTSPQLLEYKNNYYESRSWVCVFRSPYRSTATTNRIDLNIPMGGLLVQRDTLDLRAAVYWSTPISYNTVGGAGNNTADSGYSPRRVILGYGGGHGIFNTGQQQCNWPSAAGAIGAGFDGSTCGSFPNDLVWGTGNGSTATYDNRSGIWSHWVYWS